MVSQTKFKTHWELSCKYRAMVSPSRLDKFIVVSVVFHLFIVGLVAVISKKETIVPLEISFGTGNSRGGSGPVGVKAITKQEIKKAEAVKPPKASKHLKSLSQSPIDAPVVAEKEKITDVKDEVSKVNAAINKNVAAIPGEGNGIGTGGEGTGTGYTSGAGAGINDAMVKYRGLIHQLVTSKKKYPRSAQVMQHEGRVVIRVKLSKDGHLLDVKVLESSKYKSLTNASLEAIKKIDKFPNLPQEAGLEDYSINIPFEYEINNGDFI